MMDLSRDSNEIPMQKIEAKARPERERHKTIVIDFRMFPILGKNRNIVCINKPLFKKGYD